MSILETILVSAALLGAGMMAGLFGAFSTFLMSSLAKLGARPGMEAMQMINRVILCRSFFAVFFGTGVLSLVLIVLRGGDGWILAGALSYLLLCLAVTIVGNVPLNDRLEGSEAGTPSGEAMWAEYRLKWGRWNHLRSVATVVSTVCFAVGLAG